MDPPMILLTTLMMIIKTSQSLLQLHQMNVVGARAGSDGSSACFEFVSESERILR